MVPKAVLSSIQLPKGTAGAVLRYAAHMKGEQKTVTKPKQPNKLDDHPLIPEADFHTKLKTIFSVPKSELDEHIRNNPSPHKSAAETPNQ